MKSILFILSLILSVNDAYRSGVFDLYSRETEIVDRGTLSLFTVEDALGVNCSEPVCDGDLADIYCRGEILATAWSFGLQDVCPGTRLRVPVSLIHDNFEKLSRPVTMEDFQDFCNENFMFVPYLEVAPVPDWKSWPKLFNKIKDKEMVALAQFVNEQWPLLNRRFTPDVLHNRSFYPVVPVPHAFFVPGGRFQVYFYWDSYWILKGLLASDMFNSAKGILQNFAYTIEHHGFIPNSGQIQLSRRSQPPLFTQMVADYITASRDFEFVKEMLPLLIKEMAFWETNRTTEITIGDHHHKFYQYRAASNCPRPESFLVDVVAAKNQSVHSSELIWSSLASACESGLDFTSRWYGKPQNRKGIKTNLIIPVDLNVFMVQNYRQISNWSMVLGNKEDAILYDEKAEALQASINEVMFDEHTGAWFDYDMEEGRLRQKFYPSNIYPLLINTKSEAYCDQAVAYLEATGVLNFKGGVPNSFHNNSVEQWDFPNTWAPSTHLFVASLLSCSSNHKAQVYAKEAAEKFLKTVNAGVKRFGKIWEKYDVRYDNGRSGRGGEYLPQYGFGWTNGVVLEFIRLFFTFNEVSSEVPYAQSLVEVQPRNQSISENKIFIYVFLVMLCFMSWFACAFAFRLAKKQEFRDERAHLLTIRS